MYRLLLNIFPQGKYCAVRELLFEITYRIWWSVERAISDPVGCCYFIVSLYIEQ